MAWSSAKRRSPCSSSKPVNRRVDVVERVGPGRVARDQHALPRGQARIQLAADLLGAPAQRVDRPLPLRRLRQHAEGLDLLQQDADRLFEFEKLWRHRRAQSRATCNVPRATCAYVRRATALPVARGTWHVASPRRTVISAPPTRRRKSAPPRGPAAPRGAPAARLRSARAAASPGS